MSKLNSALMLPAIFLFTALVNAGCGGSNSTPAAAPAATQFVPAGSTSTATSMTSLFDSNQLYFNVQSAAIVNGEIRGEVTPSATVYATDAGNPFAPNPANNPVTFGAILGGDQVRPRNVVTNAAGYGSVTLNPLTKKLSGFIVTSGIDGIGARINVGLPGNSGALVLALEGGPVVWTVPANTVLTDAQIASLTAGACYFDIQSSAFPGGEIRGQLNQQVRCASLKGANEVPPVASSASGTGFIGLNPSTGQLYGFVKVTGLGSAVTSAVIRFGDAATNGPGIIDLINNGNGIWSVPIRSNPVLSAAVLAAFNSDGLYVNIHTVDIPGGELRGQLLSPIVRIGTATLGGSKEVPPVFTLASGTGILALNSVTEQVSGSVKTVGVAATAVNINSGSTATNGPILLALTKNSPVIGAPSPGLSFALDIQPIFSSFCAVPTCHVTGSAAPMSLMTGVSYNAIGVLVTPGDAAGSYFFQRVTGAFPPQMPLNRPPLNAARQDLIKSWIDNGALDN